MCMPMHMFDPNPNPNAKPNLVQDARVAFEEFAHLNRHLNPNPDPDPDPDPNPNANPKPNSYLAQDARVAIGPRP